MMCLKHHMLYTASEKLENTSIFPVLLQFKLFKSNETVQKVRDEPPEVKRLQQNEK